MAKITHLKYGSPLTSSNLSSPDRQLELAIQDLTDRIDTAEFGTGLFLYTQTTDSSAVSGSPVYWNAASERWEPALATFSVLSSGVVTPAASAIVGGIVFRKTTSTTATILVGGSADFANTPLMDPSPLAEGLYYLSSSNPGTTTLDRPAIAVPVFYVIGTRVLFSTSIPDPTSHEHKRLHLECVPAGTHTPPTTIGQTHTITSANSSLKGWLPASDPVFDGTAPAGAKFGYNISQDPALQTVFPPIPLESVSVTWDTGLESWLIGGMDLKVGGDLIQIDNNGIWWMTDEYNKVPWPTDYDTNSPPAEIGMSLTLDTTILALSTSGTVVTSLQSKSPILEITRCDGTPGTTGGLSLDLDFSNNIDSDNPVTGPVFLKDIDPDTGSFLIGNAVEGVVAGSNTSITSTHQRNLVPGDTSTPLVHQGVVTITADVNPGGREIPLSFVRFSDAQVNNIGPIAYLGFPPGQSSSLTAQVMIPRGGLTPASTIKFRIEFLAPVAGGFPTPTVSVRRVVAATSSLSLLPTTDTPLALTMPGGIGSVTDRSYFSAETSDLPVQAGDTLFVTITRPAGDGYPGDVGLLRIGAVLV